MINLEENDPWPWFTLQGKYHWILLTKIDRKGFKEVYVRQKYTVLSIFILSSSFNCSIYTKEFKFMLGWTWIEIQIFGLSYLTLSNQTFTALLLLLLLPKRSKVNTCSFRAKRIHCKQKRGGKNRFVIVKTKQNKTMSDSGSPKKSPWGVRKRKKKKGLLWSVDSQLLSHNAQPFSSSCYPFIKLLQFGLMFIIYWN